MAAAGSETLMSGTETTVSVQNMSIGCPDGWRDASMLIVAAEAPSPSGVTPNIVVTREPLSDTLPTGRVERLEEFVERQIDGMREALTDFREIARRRVTSERLTASLTIDWISDGVPVTQWLTYAYANENTVVISTASAGRKEFSDLEFRFRSILQSFRIN